MIDSEIDSSKYLDLRVKFSINVSCRKQSIQSEYINLNVVYVDSLQEFYKSICEDFQN